MFINYSFKDFISKLSVIEIFSISWIIGLSISLCITNQIGYDRRMIGLFIPFYLLSIFYLHDSSTLKNKLKFISSNKRISIYFFTVISRIIEKELKRKSLI